MGLFSRLVTRVRSTVSSGLRSLAETIESTPTSRPEPPQPQEAEAAPVVLPVDAAPHDPDPSDYGIDDAELGELQKWGASLGEPDAGKTWEEAADGRVRSMLNYLSELGVPPSLLDELEDLLWDEWAFLDIDVEDY